MLHPFADLIGMKVEFLEPGKSECSVPVCDKLMNPHNVIHGGVLYSLADTGMGAALYPMLLEGQLCATIEIKINYYAPVYDGSITCVTEVVNKGKTVANLDSEIFCGDRLVAKANGNYSIFMPSATR